MRDHNTTQSLDINASSLKNNFEGYGGEKDKETNEERNSDEEDDTFTGSIDVETPLVSNVNEVEEMPYPI